MGAYDRLWVMSLLAILASCLMLLWQQVALTAGPGFLTAILTAAMGWLAFRHLHRFETSLGRTAILFVHGVSLFATISFAGALATYALAKGTEGWFDAPLHAVDLAIGFDWLALHKTWASYPGLFGLGRTAYLSISLTPFLLVAGLTAYDRHDVLQRFLKAFALALAMTVVVFALLPTKGAFSYLLGGHADYLPVTTGHQVHVIEALRTGSLKLVDVGTVIGIIGFPSFHTTAGLLFAWAAWSIPCYRFPMLVVNAAMIAATPIEGSHYLVELIAGAVVAAASIMLCRHPSSSSTASPAQMADGLVCMEVAEAGASIPKFAQFTGHDDDRTMQPHHRGYCPAILTVGADAVRKRA